MMLYLGAQGDASKLIPKPCYQETSTTSSASSSCRTPSRVRSNGWTSAKQLGLESIGSFFLLEASKTGGTHMVSPAKSVDLLGRSRRRSIAVSPAGDTLAVVASCRRIDERARTKSPCSLESLTDLLPALKRLPD